MKGFSSLLAWILVASVVGGCAHTRGTLSDGAYQGPGGLYSVETPRSPGWRALSVEDQNDIAWAHDDNAAVMHIDSECSSTMDVPLTALTNHLLIGFTEREIKDESLVNMAGREALRTHMVAKLDGVARELLVQVLKKDRCVYDFALVAPVGERFAASLPDFDSVLKSFRTAAEVAP